MNSVHDDLGAAILEAAEAPELSGGPGDRTDVDAALAVRTSLRHYFVSESDMRKLEEGVDLDEMVRLINFLSEGLKLRKPPRIAPVLQLPVGQKQESFLHTETGLIREVLEPLELDWEEFNLARTPKSDVSQIMSAAHVQASDAVTPNINMEVQEKFTLKQRLLYKDLPEETYLLLAIGADLEPLLAAAEEYKQDHPEMTHERFVGLCADVFRGYGVRFYYQMVYGQEPIGDQLDRLVAQQKGKIDGLVQEGVLKTDDIEAQLAALFLVHEKMRHSTDEMDAIYGDFVKSDAMKKVA